MMIVELELELDPEVDSNIISWDPIYRLTQLRLKLHIVVFVDSMQFFLYFCILVDCPLNKEEWL